MGWRGPPRRRARAGTLASFRRCSPVERVLMLNQLSFNVGFFMVLPYLSGYLREDLGFATWIVGLVLGVRTLSQQGLFVVGGSLSDRVGYKPVIVVGCVIRVVGFGLFAVVESVPGVIAAAVLTGFAAALFSPAVETYLAHEAGDRRVDVFALFTVVGEVGALIGPLVGVLLLRVDFRLVSLVASGVFVLITLVQLRFLPAREGGEARSGEPVLQDWGHALRNRAFVVFALGMTGYIVLFNQLYLAFPLEVRRVTGSDSGVGAVFVLSSLIWIAAQVPVTAYAKARWSPSRAVVTGLAVMAAAFVPLLLAAGNAPAADATPAATALALAPVLVATGVLTLGMMITRPFAMALIPALSGGRRLGTYYGLYYTAGGIGVVLGNALSGALFDVADTTGLAPLPWVAMLLVGAAAAATIAMMDRSGMLPGVTSRA